MEKKKKLTRIIGYPLYFINTTMNRSQCRRSILFLLPGYSDHQITINVRAYTPAHKQLFVQINWHNYNIPCKDAYGTNTRHVLYSVPHAVDRNTHIVTSSHRHTFEFFSFTRQSFRRDGYLYKLLRPRKKFNRKHRTEPIRMVLSIVRCSNTSWGIH